MRLSNWQERFSAFGKARASMPFAWGSNDCCSFAAAGVEAVTGVNPMASVAHYASEFGAFRRIAEVGDLRLLASQYLGQPASPLMAAVGDVVLVRDAGREMLGICNGTSVLAPGEFGIALVGMETAVAVWKI